MLNRPAQPRGDGRPAPTFRPITNRRSFEQICDRIREEFANGTLRPGDKLPSERVLAEQFGVGRGAVREALRALEIAGIVRLKKGAKGGAFIRSGEPTNITQAFQDMVHLGTISVNDLTEARLLIMEVVVKLAAERATEADFLALERNVDQTESLRADQGEERMEAASGFYKLLAAATRNQILIMIVDSLTDIVRVALSKIHVRRGTLIRDLIGSRRRFLNSLRNRRADAAIEELSRHLRELHNGIARAQKNATRRTRPTDSAMSVSPMREP
jgi:GntR family transcriptional repressor for pyruvate dehydrogenase complex